MPKDFSTILSNPQNFTDYEAAPLPTPSPAFNPPSFSPLASLKLLISTGLLSLLTAPLTTSYISLQLSINPVRPQPSPMISIPKVSPELYKKTLLIAEHNMKNSYSLPFKPSKYSSYKAVFQGLANQGLLGLYKGNLIGVLYHWIGVNMKLYGAFALEDIGMSKVYKEVGLLMTYTLIDMALHPIQTLQTRYILQSRVKKFALYKNIADFVNQGGKGKGYWKKLYFQGILIHIPKNILIIGAMNINEINHFLGFDQNQLFLLSNILANILSFPLMTLMRRMMCQDNKPFMLDDGKYKGFIDGMAKIFKEEGIKGAYRGFGGFFIVSSFMLALNFTYQETIAF